MNTTRNRRWNYTFPLTGHKTLFTNNELNSEKLGRTSSSTVESFCLWVQMPGAMTRPTSSQPSQDFNCSVDLPFSNWMFFYCKGREFLPKRD